MSDIILSGFTTIFSPCHHVVFCPVRSRIAVFGSKVGSKICPIDRARGEFMLRAADLQILAGRAMTEATLIACASIVASPAIGVCRGTNDLRAILRARFTELGVSFETVDHIAGLPARYTARLLGPQPKRFGAISFDALLGAAGIKLIAVEDIEALDRVDARLAPLRRIDAGGRRRRKIILKFSSEFMRQIGKLGGHAKHANALRRKAISDVRRQAALTRWRRLEVTEQLAASDRVEVSPSGDTCAGPHGALLAGIGQRTETDPVTL